MRELFCGVFRRLRRHILAGISGRYISRNSKGDRTKYFDKFAESFIISRLKKGLKHNAVIISEELKSALNMNKNKNQESYYVVIDPVDGSDNYAKAAPFTAMGIGVFDSKLNPVAGFGGNFFSGEWFYADAKGVRFGGQRKHQKDTSGKRTAIFVYSHTDLKTQTRLARASQGYDMIRSYGATVGELLLVLSGRADVFVDLRGDLTLENFAPFFAAVKKSRAVMADENGKDITLKTLSMKKGYKMIFAKDRAALKRALRLLKK